MIFGYSRDWKRLTQILESEKNSLKTPIQANNIRVSFLPQFEDSNDASTRNVVGKVWAWVVPRSTKDVDVTWRFLKYMATKENQVSFYTQTGLPTSRLDLIAEQANEPNIGIFARQSKFAREHEWLVSRSDMKKKFEYLVQELNDGKILAKTALSDLESSTTDHLRRMIKINDSLQTVEKTPTAVTPAK
jgi:ABC-type glycerol-3-phosphate transport system substrate-binding protein